jgi:Ca2+-binding RTX toxin-like protein
VIEGGGGNDILSGGLGLDTLSYEHADAGVSVSLALSGIQSTIGAGSDVVSGFENLTGSAFADMLTGDDSSNIIVGGAGDDHIYGAGGDDVIHAGLGNDVIDGGAGYDLVAYDDATSAILLSLATGTATGGGGSDSFSGIEGAIGSRFSDTLTGGASANTISGMQGNDVITGGGGADFLTGGSGGDRFVLTHASDSAVGADDVITDFSSAQNDRIDLRLLPGKFTFIGDSAFDGHAGEVHYTTSGSDLLVSGDIDGDGHADFEIKLIGIQEVEAHDFFL